FGGAIVGFFGELLFGRVARSAAFGQRLDRAALILLMGLQLCDHFFVGGELRLERDDAGLGFTAFIAGGEQTALVGLGDGAALQRAKFQRVGLRFGLSRGVGELLVALAIRV